MSRPIGIQKYLKSISNIVLPEHRSQVTKDFVKYVVGAHSWYKGPNTQPWDVNMIGFNFYIGPGPLIESKGGLNERVHKEFKNLKYGVPGTLLDVQHQIPREIYDAGLVIVPGDYKSEQSQKIMVATIANMIEAIKEYRVRHVSLMKD